MTFSGVFTTNNATTGENITVNIGNDTVATGTVNTEGSVSFTITRDYSVGTFELEFYHNNKLLKTTQWTVNKIPTTITWFKGVKSGSKVRFTAIVKSGSVLVSGVTVRFTINGKSYNVVTKNGQASITATLTKSTNTIYAQTIQNTKYSASARKLTMKLANLKIIKITRKSNRYYIYVKNYGKAPSIKNSYLRLYYKRGKKTYSKIVRFNAIKAGKTLRVTINFYRYTTHRKYYKYAYVNYKTRSLEYNYKDNTKKFRK